MNFRQFTSAGRKFLSKPKVKSAIIVLILLLTAVAFVLFFIQHPDYVSQLARISPWWVVAVIVLNIPAFIVLVFIYDAGLRLCGRHIEWRENFLLSAYSSIVNFFGPLQSGPGVRAAYLKTRHKVRIRDYTLAMLLYYGLYSLFSALFLLVGARPWWQTLLSLLAVAGFSVFVIKKFIKRDKQATESHFSLKGKVLAVLIILTFLQVLLLAITYFVELRAVNSHISWGQAMSYTGAANFALFLSITPDAIGFRETFLVFSRNLHHVSTGNILSANIIDRGAYVIFLVLLFILVLSMHATEKLRLKGWRRESVKAG